MLCRRLPPIIAQRVRGAVYPYERAKADNYAFTVRSQTGSMFRGTTLDYHGYPFAVLGYFEWRNVAVAIAATRPGDTIIEVGANVGTETIGLSDAAGSAGKVVAFEPLPSNLAALKQVVADATNGNIMLMPYALSDTVKTLQFRVPPAVSSGTGHIVHSGEGAPGERIDIDCRTLDSLAEDIGPASLIITDTEGEETAVLRGGREYIQAHRPVLVLEAQPKLLRRSGSSIEGLHRELSGLGYTIYSIERFGIKPVNELSQTRGSNWVCFPSERAALARKVGRTIFRIAVMPCVQGLNPLRR
jgi:FkbM family methyltransferase